MNHYTIIVGVLLLASGPVMAMDEEIGEAKKPLEEQTLSELWHNNWDITPCDKFGITCQRARGTLKKGQDKLLSTLSYYFAAKVSTQSSSKDEVDEKDESQEPTLQEIYQLILSLQQQVLKNQQQVEQNKNQTDEVILHIQKELADLQEGKRKQEQEDAEYAKKLHEELNGDGVDPAAGFEVLGTQEDQ